MSRINWALKLSMFIVLSAIMSAAAFDFQVKASVSASQVFIGDVFSYSIEVLAPSDAKVNLPSFVGNLGHFEVKEMKNERFDIKESAGQSKFIWIANLNTFVSGDFFINPQAVEVVLGTDTARTNTDPVAIKVLNRTTGEEVDILDAEGPLKDPRLPTWALVLFGILGAAILVLLGWFLHQKFRKNDTLIELPPYEEAVLALKRLRSRDLLLTEEQAEYFTVLGLIARRYVERRFEVDILDAALTELRRRMAHVKGLPQAYKESLVLFTEETEPVKFAKMKIEKDRCDFWNEWVDRLLADTRPRPEDEKAVSEGNK